MENILDIKGLNKKYKNFSLNNISFSLPKGSIMGFIGENGAGKTTTLKSILNLISIDSGEIQILGMDNIKNEKEIKEQIGVVFDECNFPDELTTENISLIMKNIYKKWDDEAFKNYLHKFDIPDNKIVKQFSRGMKMKLRIAVALANHPKLLILDEATSGLDPIGREEMLDIFLDFIQDENNSIILSSHIISDLDKIADYITFIHKGNIIFSKSKEELSDDMGILKCNENDLNKYEKGYFLKIRKGQFGCEILISNKNSFVKKYPNATIDYASIEEIMLFFVRGEHIS